MQISGILIYIGQFIIKTIDLLGYIGTAFLMALGGMGIPLPSEIIMPFSGALVAQRRFNFLGITLAASIGTLLGSTILYCIGRYVGRNFFIRYGRYLFLSQKELTIAEKFFLKYGWIAILLGEMIPVIRAYIAFPAGIARVKFVIFFVACFVGAFMWSFALTFAGMKLGDNWEQIEPFFRQVDYLILLLIFLLVALAIWLRFKGRTSLT